MKINGDFLMNKRLLVFLVAMAVSPMCPHAQAQIVVIANQGVAAATISRADLRDVFTGNSSSLRNGAQVSPVLLKPGAVNDEFLSLYIGKSDSGFRAGWRSILFSGQGVMPKTMDSEAAVVEYVAHTPGAIAYVGRGTSHDGVKILAVR